MLFIYFVMFISSVQSHHLHLININVRVIFVCAYICFSSNDFNLFAFVFLFLSQTHFFIRYLSLFCDDLFFFSIVRAMCFYKRFSVQGLIFIIFNVCALHRIGRDLRAFCLLFITMSMLKCFNG